MKLCFIILSSETKETDTGRKPTDKPFSSDIKGELRGWDTDLRHFSFM